MVEDGGQGVADVDDAAGVTGHDEQETVHCLQIDIDK